MTTAYTTGQITLTNGSAVVTGIGTAWVVSLIAGGLIAAEAGGNLLPIESVDSDTSITAAIEWKGATGTYDYALVRDTAYLQQLNVNSNTLARLIAELDAGTIFKYDASGDLGGRDSYDTRAKGFSYLVFIGVSEPSLYVKASSELGDWDGPFSYGTGPIGPEGPAGYVNFRGAYSGATAYARNDGVLYNGSSFVALQDGAGNAPPTLPAVSNAYWQLLAIKGTDGTGTGDVVGPEGADDDTPAFFDGTTGKLLKYKTKTQFKTWLATTALDVSFDNSTANLSGSPATVQAAINALAANTGAGKNDALFAMEIADLKGVRLGMVGGVADTFDDVTGIDAAASSNYVYDATGDNFSPGGISTSAAASATTDISGAVYTIVDRALALTNGSNVISVGIYSLTAAAMAFKIVRRVSATTYDVLATWNVNHPGTGWYDIPVSFTIPASGSIYPATMRPASTAINSYTTPRAFHTGDVAVGNGVTAWTEDTAAAGVMRVTYSLANMTLVSVGYAVSTVPSTARIAVQLADTLALTPGVDFTMEVSRDNGTTWTAVALALTMPLFGGVKMYEGIATISGQPSGTSMRWRFKTLTNKAVIASGVVLQQS